MTLADILDKILQLFGAKPKKIRALVERVGSVKAKITNMEEGLDEVKKKFKALDEKIAELKRELAVETNEHVQQSIMDQIEGIEPEFRRTEDLQRQKQFNLNAACELRNKLEQLLENALNGGDTAELEEVLYKVGLMGEDLSGVKAMLDEMSQSKSVKIVREATARKPSTASQDSASIAARRAAMLGQTAAPAATPDSASIAARRAAMLGTPAPTPAPASAPAAAEAVATPSV